MRYAVRFMVPSYDEVVKDKTQVSVLAPDLLARVTRKCRIDTNKVFQWRSLYRDC
jgi:hypothetical protein